MAFTIESGSEAILLDGVVTTVKDALQKKRESNPNAVVCYHKLSSESGGSFKFDQAPSLTLTMI